MAKTDDSRYHTNQETQACTYPEGFFHYMPPNTSPTSSILWLPAHFTTYTRAMSIAATMTISIIIIRIFKNFLIFTTVEYRNCSAEIRRPPFAGNVPQNWVARLLMNEEMHLHSSTIIKTFYSEKSSVSGSSTSTSPSALNRKRFSIIGRML